MLKFSSISCIVFALIINGCAAGTYAETQDDAPEVLPLEDNTPLSALPDTCIPNTWCWEIVLTPTLTNAWKRNIVSAYAAWERVLGIKYHYRIVEGEQPSEASKLTRQFIRWVQVESTDIPGYSGYAYGAERLVKVIPVSGELQKLAIATHELGHLLGLGHVEDESIPSIMHPGVKPEERISCHDERNVCALWGCTVTAKCQ